MRPVIVVFAKAPIAGRIRMRLASRVGDETAARLHEAFVKDALDVAQSLGDVADVELHTDLETGAWPEFRGRRDVQSSGSLSTRTIAAIAKALETRSQAIVLATDSPSLPPEHLRAMLDNQSDLAIGLCDQGGYYAVSGRRAHSAMFHGVNWSAADAMSQARAAADRAGLSFFEAPLWYGVETPSDLARLIGELSETVPEVAPSTRRVVKEEGL